MYKMYVMPSATVCVCVHMYVYVHCTCTYSLRRLAGGGMKRRGREDALNNIVDIIGDEVMEDVKVYRRHYGEDPSITKLYKVDNVSTCLNFI